MAKIKTKLPDKPSELLKMAMDDLEAAEESDEYSVDMGHWYFPNISKEGSIKTCKVCLAGSVMANMLPSDRIKSCSPNTLKFNGEIDGDTRDKLMAIDEIRSGFIEHGINRMGIDTDDAYLPNYLDMTGYREDPVVFKEEIKNVIHELKKQGY